MRALKPHKPFGRDSLPGSAPPAAAAAHGGTGKTASFFLRTYCAFVLRDDAKQVLWYNTVGYALIYSALYGRKFRFGKRSLLNEFGKETLSP